MKSEVFDDFGEWASLRGRGRKAVLFAGEAILPFGLYCSFGLNQKNQKFKAVRLSAKIYSITLN